MRTLLAVVALLLLPAAASAASPQRLATAYSIADPAIAGDATLFGQTDYLRETAVVDQGEEVDTSVRRYSVKRVTAGQAPVTIHTQDASNTGTIDESDTYAFSFAASASDIAVLDEGDYETGVAVHWEDWLDAGAQGAKLQQVLHCEDTGADQIRPVVPFALDGAHVVYVEGSCPPREPQAVVDGATRFPVAAGQTVDALAVAGDFLAYSVTGDDINHPFHRVVVARVSTGAEAYHVDVPASGALAVTPDGTVAFDGYDHLDATCPTGNQLGWASVAEPTLHTLAGLTPCSARLALAGGRIGYVGTDRALHSVDLAGHDVPLIGDVSSFAMAADRAAVVVPDCAGDALWSIDAIDAPAPPTGAATTCPASVRSRRLALRGRRVKVRIACAHGCHGGVAIGSSRSFQRSVGDQPYDIVGRGTRSVTLTLRRADARRLAAHRRAYVFLTGPATPDGNARTRRVRVTLR